MQTDKRNEPAGSPHFCASTEPRNAGIRQELAEKSVLGQPQSVSFRVSPDLCGATFQKKRGDAAVWERGYVFPTNREKQGGVMSTLNNPPKRGEEEKKKKKKKKEKKKR